MLRAVEFIRESSSALKRRTNLNEATTSKGDENYEPEIDKVW